MDDELQARLRRLRADRKLVMDELKWIDHQEQEILKTMLDKGITPDAENRKRWKPR